MYSDTEDIPLIPDRQARFDQLLVHYLQVKGGGRFVKG